MMLERINGVEFRQNVLFFLKNFDSPRIVLCNKVSALVIAIKQMVAEFMNLLLQQMCTNEMLGRSAKTTTLLPCF